MAEERKDGHKLFVGNLPCDISQEELQIVFTTYGEVTDIHVMDNSKSKTGHVAAFVSYARRESAEDAIAVLDDKYKIREGGDEIPMISVSWPKPKMSGPKGKGGYDGGGKGGYDGGSKGSYDGGGKGSYDKGSWKWQGQNDYHQHQPTGGASNNWQSGGGGKSHSGSDAGGQSSWGSSWGTTGGWKAGAKGVPDSGKGVRGDSGKAGTFGDNHSVGKLFVGNLPADITEEAIRYVFSTYGKIENVFIMNGKSKSGQACAFVEYSRPEEAETAIATLHETYEIRQGEGPIVVKKAGTGPPRKSGPY